MSIRRRFPYMICDDVYDWCVYMFCVRVCVCVSALCVFIYSLGVLYMCDARVCVLVVCTILRVDLYLCCVSFGAARCWCVRVCCVCVCIVLLLWYMCCCSRI